jgi:hypothetical protein
MILIVSSGGNGQTYFMDFLIKNGIETNCISDKDGLKHLPEPKYINTNIKVEKCIFLYNNPLKSILSLERRNWLYDQCNKLGNPFKLNKKELELSSLLMKTLEKNHDVYGIEYQFNNWYNSTTMFPILFLDFNEIEENTEVINRFIGKKLDYNMFKIKTRNCYEYEIDEHIQEIYDKLYNKIKEMSKYKNDLMFK